MPEQEQSWATVMEKDRDKEKDKDRDKAPDGARVSARAGAGKPGSVGVSAT